MRKFDFWKTDWFLGVMVVIVVALFNRFRDLVPSLERKAYDLGVNATVRTASDPVAVIAIDEAIFFRSPSAFTRYIRASYRSKGSPWRS